MNPEIVTAVNWMTAGRKVALATVVSTWGSSPRPVGSQLVVDEDGHFEGSVSGGCIESTIITEAQYLIGKEKHLLVAMGISNDQAWDAGLACGGIIEIFIEVVEMSDPVYRQILLSNEDQHNFCILLDLDSGKKSLIRSSDSLANMQTDLKIAVRRAISTGDSLSYKFDDKRFFIQGFAPKPQLIIIGAVHISQPLASIAGYLGYKTMIVDPRKAFANNIRFPGVDLVLEWPDKAFKQIRLHSNTAVAALSHLLRLDDAALCHALRSDVFYIGALGSKKTHAARIERLEKMGFTKYDLDRVHGPIGIKIGSVTPHEIALSIMAEITKVKRNSSCYQFDNIKPEKVQLS